MKGPPPVPAFHGRAAVYLLTGEEAARVDREAITARGVSSAVLMENAGRSAALILDRIWPEGTVVVAVGSGHNGGDGLVLARTLAAQGRTVRLVTPASRSSDDPLLHGWTLPVHSPAHPPLNSPAHSRSAASPADEAGGDGWEGALADAAVIVDALLGTGAGGPPRPAYASLIRAIRGSGVPVLSLDLPSGVDATSGEVVGEAVQATVTVAFGAPKVGCLRFPGRARTGRLIAVEIGFPPPEPGMADAQLITPGWVELHRPRRPAVTHKKAQGRVVILAGSDGMAGAAVLAARGALRAGAGYVQVASLPSNREVLQQAVPEAIFVDATDEEALAAAVRACDVLVAGPGIGTDGAAAGRLDALLPLPNPGGIVLDADGLTLLGAGALENWSGAASPSRRLLTPHPGEMARLGATPEWIRDDPLAAAREGAERWQSALLLKGNPSVVAAPDSAQVPPPDFAPPAAEARSPVLVSATGSSDLARAGMGDVLAGVAGAFLARGCTGREAGALALHFTGRAAQLSGLRESLLPSDVAEALAEAMNEAAPARSELRFPFITLDLGPAA